MLLSTLSRRSLSSLVRSEDAADQGDGVDELTDHLVGRVDAAIPRQTIRARVCREFETFGSVRVRQFVPVFVERRVRAGLRG
jgi:hypothetical protein